MKDANVYRAIPAVNIDPDGKLDVASLQEDIDIFTRQGLIQGSVDLKKVVDTSFIDAAVKDLGPYKRADGSGKPRAPNSSLIESRLLELIP